MKSLIHVAQQNLSYGAPLLVAITLLAGCGSDPVAAVTISPTAANTATSTDIPTAPPTATAAPSVTPAQTPSPTRTLTPTDTVTPTSSPTETPTATATNTSTPRPPVDGVDSYEITVTLPTYPHADFLIEQVDATYNIPVFYFNRPEYEAEPRQPQPVDYTGVVLENKYLRLTFLPELGGRLYSAVIKSTGQEIFYHNPVVKPSRYGVLQPYEANWWLAAGGMDWAYPVQEHGYRFGVPWEYTVQTNPAAAAITLSDTATDRTGLQITVSLPTDSAVFSVQPQLTNNAADTAPVQLWVNAALALSSSSMSPDTQFVLPTEVITVHSRGELGWSVPDSGEPAPWPQIGETDLRDYRQWANYLGFFVSYADAPFIGAYNPHTQLGVARLGSRNSTGKLFAFGPDFADRTYTDDNSQYFEIWGGANAGFWPEYDIAVPPAGSLGWREQWWPLAGLPGLTWATERVAIAVERAGSSVTLSALVAQPTTGQVRISTGDSIILRKDFSASPAEPMRWQFSAESGPIDIEFIDSTETVLLTYQSH
jgi:hypothetical protein